MKKLYLLATLLLWSTITFAQVKQIAILEIVDKEGKVSYAHKLMLRSSLAKAITNTEGYEAYERTEIDAILGEQYFQRTGMVNEDQIKQLGEMTGVDYILIAETGKIDNVSLFLAAKILNVETARTEQTDYVMIKTENILQGCEELAAKLLNVQQKKTQAQSFVASTQEPILENTDYTTRLVYVGKKAFLDDKLVTKEDYKKYIKELKHVDQVRYQQAQTWKNVGWGLFGTSPVMFALGFTFLSLHYNYVDEMSDTEWRDYITGFLACTIIGGTLMAGSVPMICVGHKRCDNIKQQALENHIKTTSTPITYNITAGQNGIGLAINF